MEKRMDDAGKEKKDTLGQSLGKNLAGTAILTTVGAAGGAIYGAVKGGGIKTTATIGGAVGALASIGFGKMIYESVTGATKNDSPQSHAERILAEREASKNNGHER
jgi:hypothetical protein